MNTLDKNRERKMCFYGRVSTEQEEQLSALKNQMQWYDDQLQYHDNWTCVEKYIDEGITGTQAKKRPAFLKMIEDAKKGRFDLIVTREVSRFARNTVETLQFTRDLKYKYNVEVYFIEDNIWTMDGDGELRLTIMATLAQEESRKTSERVKAGQKISRDNGVLYGSGNILGYERVGDTYIINEEQAETVKIIFNLYLQGFSAAKIRDELTLLKRKTANGKYIWYTSVIINILKNPTYKGVMRYCRTYSNNYLEQKKLVNPNPEEYIYKKGDFQAIIPEDEWDKVQEIMAKKVKPSKKGKRNVGSKISSDVWMHKLKCACGASVSRNRWRMSKAGIPSFGYQCTKQRNIGSKRFREQNGLDTEGYCGISMVADWKLAFMGKEIIATIWNNRKEAVEKAYEMIAECYTDESNNIDEQIENINKKIEENQNRINNLIIMRTDDEITKDEFTVMRKKYDDKIFKLKNELDELLNDNTFDSKAEIDKQLKEIKNALNEAIDFSKPQLDDYIIDRFIDKVVALGDNKFRWYINLSGNVYNDKEINEQYRQDIVIGIEGRKNKQILVNENGEKISLSFNHDGKGGSSRKIGECLFDKLVFGFNQAKQWKKQVYGTLHRNSWYRDIEAEIILVF